MDKLRFPHSKVDIMEKYVRVTNCHDLGKLCELESLKKVTNFRKYCWKWHDDKLFSGLILSEIHFVLVKSLGRFGFSSVRASKSCIYTLKIMLE